MGFLDFIVYRPNRQLETQMYYQSQWKKPVYMRHPYAKYYIPAYGIVFTFTMGYMALSVSDLILGKNKKAAE